MSGYACRLERLATALPDPGIEAILRHLAARDGYTPAEIEALRADAQRVACERPRLTPEEAVTLLAAETSEDPAIIREELAEFERIYAEVTEARP